MRLQRARGYSLIELLLVVGLLALIAAVAVPAFDGGNDILLDRRAADVAAAMRFAHAEAIRTGKPYGVNVSASSQTVRVYRLNDDVNPAVVVYDVYNPLTKQPYDLSFGADSSDVVIESYYFKFKDVSLGTPYVGFSGETGVPKYNDSGTIRMLETGYIRLGLDELNRTISVAPMTGRVTVQ